MQSKFIVIYLHNYSHLCICLASSKDLDTPGQAYHHHEHTDLLLEHKTMQELWDDYGLVGNIEVHMLFKIFLLLHISNVFNNRLSLKVIHAVISTK